MEFFGDYHLHTTYSDGHGTVAEMVEAGCKAGLLEIGIAEHGPWNIRTGIASENILLRLKKEMQQLESQLKDEYPDISLYTGVEANVISLDGKLDISSKVLRQLDYVLVGLHPFIRPAQFSDFPWVVENSLSMVLPGAGWQRRMAAKNTKALVEAIYRYRPLVISHPGLKMAIDLAETVQACQTVGTCWEINAGHKFPDYRTVKQLAEGEVDFVVNSDAHFPESVGALGYGSWVLEKAGVPQRRVKNARG